MVFFLTISYYSVDKQHAMNYSMLLLIFIGHVGLSIGITQNFLYYLRIWWSEFATCGPLSRPIY